MVATNSLPPEFDRGVVTTVHQGDCFASKDIDLTYSTVLGSCISACVRDREAGVGGMNHFLLAEPPNAGSDKFSASARYGAFAMEQLINMVLSRGSGRKSNLEIKVFGGGNINSALNDVGARNVEFVREFLANEGYVLSGADVGGTFARRVLFKPYSGRAFVKRLDSADNARIVSDELALVKRRVPVRPPVDDIELF